MCHIASIANIVQKCGKKQGAEKHKNISFYGTQRN